jgi:hypothetical protein
LLALNEHHRQVVAVVDIDITDTPSGPRLKPGSLRLAGRIEASDPSTHSVHHGVFVDPDYVSMPSGNASNVSMFYWLDWPGVGSTDMSARYCFFSGWPSHKSSSSPLSVNNGALRTWQSSNAGGDYVDGAFYYWKGQNYVAQWLEPGGIRANIVHVPAPIRPPGTWWLPRLARRWWLR